MDTYKKYYILLEKALAFIDNDEQIDEFLETLEDNEQTIIENMI